MAQQEQKQKKKNPFKQTLNLPQTSFSMKANLVQNEPASEKRWAQMKLYERLREARKGGKPYVFHDGPPYANGSIHLGHLLNKCLKDFVVRARTMAGYDCPYVPGWDCHGLPIEHKVMQELGEKARDMEPFQIRRKCKDYADKFIKLQSKQMQRLLTLADYDDPYLTMDPAYEAAVLEVFADLVARGLVYRDLKPVHWSIANQTALAEAELEYEDREDTSIYVLFDVADASKLPASLGVPSGEAVALMIWTTTPWTLPANLAVAVSPQSVYRLYKFESNGATKYAVLADALGEQVLAAGGATSVESLDDCTGVELADAGVTYTHPFMDDGANRPVVTADYVTLEDGTGLVHTAPGHGVEDYQTGLREKFDIYCPVLEDGTFDRTAPNWLHGVVVWDANDKVLDQLRSTGHLFYDHKFMHSYPHDWRSKTPVIFRATEQWFIGVDRALEGSSDAGETLRHLALTETANDVNFIPGWGKNRMRGMLETRPDWCISRQRHWGLPIPAFFDGQGNFLLTAASVRAVAAVVREQGSNAWFSLEPADLLAKYDRDGDSEAPAALDMAGLKKASDIFDVWFESGSSWNAVIRQRFGDDACPTDLYLEGSDQHRGWFQASLLPALGVTGKSPFKTVLTHGFMVDKDGRKMSKSLGNALNVDDLMKNHGADVCRWWVASLNTDNDIKVDPQFFKDAGEEYRKVRNTVRFLLSNLSDFDASSPYAFSDADATSVDAWALGALDALVVKVLAAYEGLQFRVASEAIFNFCNDTLSAVYLAATKDRLYCDAVDSQRRRRSQTAMHTIASALVRLVAPLMPHTADEAWQALTGSNDACVHLELFPSATGVKVHEGWAAVVAYRDTVLKAVEDARQQQDIDNPLDVGVTAPGPEGVDMSAFDAVDLADLCAVSRFTVAASGDGVRVDDLRGEPRCDRSWKRDGTVAGYTFEGEQVMLSDRDAKAIGVA